MQELPPPLSILLFFIIRDFVKEWRQSHGNKTIVFIMRSKSLPPPALDYYETFLVKSRRKNKVAGKKKGKIKGWLLLPAQPAGRRLGGGQSPSAGQGPYLDKGKTTSLVRVLLSQLGLWLSQCKRNSRLSVLSKSFCAHLASITIKIRSHHWSQRCLA